MRIKTRLNKLEGKQIKTLCPIIINAPNEESPEEEYIEFNRLLTEAEITDLPIVVVSDEKHSQLSWIPSKAKVMNQFEADLTVLASSPSAQGNRNALADVFNNLSGNVICVSPRFSLDM